MTLARAARGGGLTEGPAWLRPWHEAEGYELGVALDGAASAVAEDEIDDPAEGDKLGGWPAYIQQPSLGPCARCGQPRALLLQVASDDNLAVHFGDEGRLFVATCPDHPTAVEARIEYH